MTIGTHAVQASTNVSTVSLIPSAQSTVKANSLPEDTVKLSDSVLQYLKSSQAKEAQNQNFVEQLVKAAAAGDSGALSLLTLI